MCRYSKTVCSLVGRFVIYKKIVLAAPTKTVNTNGPLPLCRVRKSDGCSPSTCSLIFRLYNPPKTRQDKTKRAHGLLQLYRRRQSLRPHQLSGAAAPPAFYCASAQSLRRGAITHGSRRCSRFLCLPGLGRTLQGHEAHTGPPRVAHRWRRGRSDRCSYFLCSNIATDPYHCFGYRLCWQRLGCRRVS